MEIRSKVQVVLVGLAMVVILIGVGIGINRDRLSEYIKVMVHPEVVQPLPTPQPEPVVETPSHEEVMVTNYMKARNSKMSIEIAELIAKFTIKTSAENNIPVELLIGIMEKESLFNPMANAEIPGKPGEYARGLMMLYQAEDIVIDKDRAYDLGYNLENGAKILNKKLSLANGDLDKALSNYSGRAIGYGDDVLKGVGRYTLFKWKKGIEAEAKAVAVK